MDNSGDWIYIVFLVVAAISGLLNTKGKKKHPTEVLGQPGYDMLPEEKSSSEKGFWEVFEEMTAQPQEPASSYSKKHKPKKKKKHNNRKHSCPMNLQSLLIPKQGRL